jgi:hypothetical protein
MSGFFGRKWLLRTKKELRKNKKDEEEGKGLIFVVLFFELRTESFKRQKKESPGLSVFPGMWIGEPRVLSPPR